MMTNRAQDILIERITLSLSKNLHLVLIVDKNNHYIIHTISKANLAHGGHGLTVMPTKLIINAANLCCGLFA